MYAPHRDSNAAQVAETLSVRISDYESKSSVSIPVTVMAVNDVPSIDVPEVQEITIQGYRIQDAEGGQMNVTLAVGDVKTGMVSLSSTADLAFTDGCSGYRFAQCSFTADYDAVNSALQRQTYHRVSGATAGDVRPPPASRVSRAR